VDTGYILILLGKVHVTPALLLSLSFWPRVHVLQQRVQMSPCQGVSVSVTGDPVIPFSCEQLTGYLGYPVISKPVVGVVR
jgi:hypothetical protein